MSTPGRALRAGRKLKSRDQALNDSTSGQFGEQPRPDIKPGAKKRAPERTDL